MNFLLEEDPPILIHDEYIDMSFFNETQAESLRPDHSILKLLSKPGEKSIDNIIPLKGSIVWFHLEGRKPNGELLDKSKSRYEKKKLKLFSDDFIQGIHISIATMLKNEVSWFKIAPKYHYFPKEIEEGIAKSIGDIKCEPLFYRIELIEFKNGETALKKLDFIGRIKKFEDSRKIGNEFFHKKDFDKAFKVYRGVIELLLKIPKALKSILKEDQLKQLDNFAEIFYGNGVLCKIRSKKWYEGIHLIEEGRKLYNFKPKILIRQAICYMKCGQWDKSEEICQAILNKNDGNQKEIQAFLREIAIERKKEKYMEKRRYKGMFDKWESEEKNENIEKKRKKLEKIEEKVQKNRDLVMELQKGVVLDMKDPGNGLDLDEEEGE